MGQVVNIHCENCDYTLDGLALGTGKLSFVKEFHLELIESGLREKLEQAYAEGKSSYWENELVVCPCCKGLKVKTNMYIYFEGAGIHTKELLNPAKCDICNEELKIVHKLGEIPCPACGQFSLIFEETSTLWD